LLLVYMSEEVMHSLLGTCHSFKQKTTADSVALKTDGHDDN